MSPHLPRNEWRQVWIKKNVPFFLPETNLTLNFHAHRYVGWSGLMMIGSSLLVAMIIRHALMFSISFHCLFFPCPSSLFCTRNSELVLTQCQWLLDVQLLVWNQHSQQPILKLTEHTAAVKAIAWSPHQSGLLASGGGTADRCIRFWNTTNGHQLNCVDTGSQVCISSSFHVSFLCVFFKNLERKERSHSLTNHHNAGMQPCLE